MSRKRSERGKAYTKFLQTPLWKEMAAECKRLAGGKCNRCPSTDRLSAHHTGYPDRWEDTTQSILECLCYRCHRMEHGLEVRHLREFAILKDKMMTEIASHYGIIHPMSDVMKLIELSEDRCDVMWIGALLRLRAESWIYSHQLRNPNIKPNKSHEISLKMLDWARKKAFTLYAEAHPDAPALYQ